MPIYDTFLVGILASVMVGFWAFFMFAGWRLGKKFMGICKNARH